MGNSAEVKPPGMAIAPASTSLVLIVGAGAGAEVNMPTGRELKQKIADALDFNFVDGYKLTRGSHVINETFRHIAARSGNQENAVFRSLFGLARLIRDAMPQAISIDHFIDAHRDVENLGLCGKLAIAQCILEAEHESQLYVDPSNIYNKLDFASVERTWFNGFFQLVTENCRQDDLVDRLSQVAIICFNYDRCIEHYLHESLQNYYGMRSELAAKVLSRLEIHHPYGTVGTLPWQPQDNGFPFGGSPHTAKLLELIESLHTFTEVVDPQRADIAAIRSCLSSAERIVFLGFAFHRINLQLLFPDNESDQERGECHLYATAHGISHSDIQEITNELSGVAKFNPSCIRLRNDLKCADLFDQYRWSLSLQRSARQVPDGKPTNRRALPKATAQNK